MPAEPLALSPRPPEPATADYDAIHGAVAATARGRWFLAEFSRRDRANDTAQVLDAIARLQAAVLCQHPPQQADQHVRIELLEMARTIARTRAEIAESRPPVHAAWPKDAADPTIAEAAERLRQIAWTMRACNVELAASDQIGQIADSIIAASAARSLDAERSNKLAEALHYLEHRIERMLDTHLPLPHAAEIHAATSPASSVSQEQADDSADAAEPHAEASAAVDDPIAKQVDHDLDGLAGDASKDENDAAVLPLEAPTPAASPVPAADTSSISPQTVNVKPTTALADIASELRAGIAPTALRTNAPLRTNTPPPKPVGATAAKPMVVADGPLAALMAMSEEERIALFS